MLVFLHFEYGKPQVVFTVYCGYGCFCLCSLSELWVPICHFVLAPSSILIMNNVLPFAIVLYILILPVLFLKHHFILFAFQTWRFLLTYLQVHWFPFQMCQNDWHSLWWKHFLISVAAVFVFWTFSLYSSYALHVLADTSQLVFMFLFKTLTW